MSRKNSSTTATTTTATSAYSSYKAASDGLIAKLRSDFKSFDYFYRFATNWYISRGLRAARLIAIGVGLYSAGHTKGVIEVVSNPRGVEMGLIEQTAKSAGADTILSKNSPQQIQCEVVGKRVIAGAKSLIRRHIKQLEEERTKVLAEKSKSSATIELIGCEEKLKKNAQDRLEWTIKLDRLRGRWDFIVLSGPHVNAFVTEFCPRKIFVHNALLQKLKVSDDELGLILSHELSHLALGHCSEKVDIDMALSIFMLFITGFINPGGIFSYIFDNWLAPKTEKLIQASFSRYHEEEADDFGLEIASEACFDTAKGIRVFKKLENYVDSVTGSHKEHASWVDSHPSMHDRIEVLSEKNKTLVKSSKERCTTYAGYLSSMIFTPK
jgi:Zn-dependent protease with chaperone function